MDTALFPHLCSTPQSYTTSILSDNPDTAVEETIHHMTRLVSRDYQSSIVGDAVEAAMSGSPDANPIAAIFYWVKSKLAFVNDVSLGAGVAASEDCPLVETLVPPAELLAFISNGSAAGDCDDFAMLGAAMLAHLDIPVRFVTVAADRNAPGQYSHVYLAAYPNGQRVPLDISHGSYPGWETENTQGKRAEWPVFGEGIKIIDALLAAGLVWFGWKQMTQGQAA